MAKRSECWPFRRMAAGSIPTYGHLFFLFSDFFVSRIRDNGHVRVKPGMHYKTLLPKIQCQSDYEKLVSETNAKETYVVHVWPSNYSVCVWYAVIVYVCVEERKRDMHVTQWD